MQQFGGISVLVVHCEASKSPFVSSSQTILYYTQLSELSLVWQWKDPISASALLKTKDYESPSSPLYVLALCIKQVWRCRGLNGLFVMQIYFCPLLFCCRPSAWEIFGQFTYKLTLSAAETRNPPAYQGLQASVWMMTNHTVQNVTWYNNTRGCSFRRKKW